MDNSADPSFPHFCPSPTDETLDEFKSKLDAVFARTYPDAHQASREDGEEEEEAQAQQQQQAEIADPDFQSLWQSGLTLSQLADQPSRYIRTGCRGLDRALGGAGLAVGRLTQIAGEASAGKSQICMQLCFRVQLAVDHGGLDGEALYIDTENSFRPDRIKEIATNYFATNQQLHSSSPQLLQFKATEVLSRVHLRKMNTSADDLCNRILGGELDQFFADHLNVRLLVVDSIAYHFRYGYEHEEDEARDQQLIQIGTKLKQLAFERNIAILITNQLQFDDEPALGPLWNSSCSTSLLLRRLEDSAAAPLPNETEAATTTTATSEPTTSKRQCSILNSFICDDTNYSFVYRLTKKGVEDDDDESLP